MPTINNWKKRRLLIALIAGLLIAGAAFGYDRWKKSGSPLDNGEILFYSESCPHCLEVDEYLTSSGRIVQRKLEVSRSRQNAELLMEKARACSLPADQSIGVPFFFNGQDCLIGSEEIISYLEKQKEN